MNANPRLYCLLAALVITNSGYTYASDLNYSYLEAAYISSDSDSSGTSIDGDGIGLGASLDVAENLAIAIAYEDLSYDFDFDGNSLAIGVDFHTPISGSGDVVISIAFLDAELSHPVLGKEDDTGNLIGIEIRHLLSPTTEVNFGFARTDIFDDTTTGYSVGLGIGNQHGLQFRASYGSADDTDTLVLGVRISI